MLDGALLMGIASDDVLQATRRGLLTKIAYCTRING